MTDSATVQYELRFQPLVENRQGFAFPCDPKGRVDLDQLGDRVRNNYLFARALVGRELAPPAVRIATRSDTDSRVSASAASDAACAAKRVLCSSSTFRKASPAGDSESLARSKRNKSSISGGATSGLTM